MSIAVVPPWWFWLAFVGILSLLIYWDISSRPNNRRWVRISLLVVALISLAGLLLKPAVSRNAPRIKLAISVLPGNNEILDSLIKAGFQITTSFDEFQSLEDRSQFEELVVIGGGLSRHQLEAINQPFQFIKSKSIPEGPINFLFSNLVVNNSGKIVFQISSNDSLTLSLSGPGLTTQQTNIADGTASTEFEIEPSLSGHLKYRIDGTRADDTLFSEIVPVHVREKPVIQALMLANTPSFEYRFLKNYLQQAGFGVAERLQISKDVYHESFVNIESESISELSLKMLETYRLLVLDASSYSTLSIREQNNIQELVKKGGLGLLWMDGSVDGDLVKTRSNGSANILLAGNAQQIELTGSGRRLTNPDQTIQIQDIEIAEAINLGLGRITVPLFDNSYTLVLKGEQILYSRIWQRMIQSVLGKSWTNETVLVPDFPRVGDLVSLKMKLEEEDSDFESEYVYLDSVRLAINENWYQLGRWESDYWPSSTGWKELNDEKFYVFDSSDWRAQKRWRQEIHGQRSAELSKSKTTENKTIDEPISNWIFFAGFLFSFGLLWLEQRLG